jgi:two-component system, repressor protein LuxO
MKTKRQPTVLLIEDDIVVAKCCKNFLESEQVKLDHVDTGAAALLHLQQAIPVAILLNLSLPDMNGMDILKYVQQQQLGCAVIVITVEDSVALFAEVMHYGAFDYLKKPFQTDQLLITLRKVLNDQTPTYFSDLNPKFPQPCSPQLKPFHQFIGASRPMLKVYRKIGKVAKSKASVFIIGESGTGKELCADAIHQESPRKDKPFIALNCAAIPHNLMESELFGHVKGAFTGADKERRGAASLADGGTLFLDEIGEMDLDLQSKLLRFVQTGTFYKVGGSQLEKVDIRFVCATNRHMLTEIKAGRFRQDLYYRLKVISIHLPSLREREQDILFLAQTFLNQYTQEEHKAFKGFTPEAEDVLLHYDWPGNVRQLQSVIHNMVLLDEGETISANMVRATLTEEIAEHTTEPQPAKHTQLLSPIPDIRIISDKALRPFSEIKKDVFIEAIEYCNGNVVQAAKELGIGKTTLYKKLREWGIPVKRKIKVISDQ